MENDLKQVDKPKPKTDKAKPLHFTKSQIVRSKKYEARRDAINALLDSGKTYSFAQVDAILKKFDKGGK